MVSLRPLILPNVLLLSTLLLSACGEPYASYDAPEPVESDDNPTQKSFSLYQGINIALSIPEDRFVGLESTTTEASISDERVESEVFRTQLQTLADNNISWVRWPVLTNIYSDLVFSDDGELQGLHAHVFDRLTRVFNALPTHMKIMPVIIDQNICEDQNICQYIANPTQRTLFIERVVIPLTSRFKQVDKIIAWDIADEIDRLAPPYSNKISDTAFVNFAEASAIAIHQHANQFVTLGCAFEESLEQLQQTSIDILQFHWYPSREYHSVPTFEDYSGIDRPVILGAFPDEDPILDEQVRRNIERAALSGAASSTHLIAL